MSEPTILVTSRHVDTAGNVLSESTVVVDAGDVLPWYALPDTEKLPEGTRLFSFRDYHTAPEGTRVRLGRKGGTGAVLVKSGDAWRDESDPSAPSLTNYGIENRASYTL